MNLTTEILTTEDASKVRLYAGLYLRTKKQTRFWGWGSQGWGSKGWRSWRWRSLRAVEGERPWSGLAEWLRQAHARLDRNALEEPAPARLESESSRNE
jgi:hypothetical protein